MRRDYMDFNIEHNHCVSNVTVTFTDTDRELTSDEVVKVYMPIRKAYMSEYNVAPTLIVGPHHKKGTLSLSFMGGQHVKDSLTKMAVNTFAEYLERYARQGLPADVFAKRMKDELEVHDIDIAPIRFSQHWLRNMSRFRKSAGAAS